MLRIAMFTTLFVLMDIFIGMNKKTEEQVTYSITLENLIHAQSETNGETGGTGGSGTDGETGRGGTDGTPQAGLHTRDVSKTITKYFKWEGGVKIFVSASTQGAE